MDPNPIPFTYELAGCLSGAPTAVLLEGALAQHEIRFEARAVAPGEPLVGDRTLLALALADPLILLALDPELFRAEAALETFRVEARLEGEGQRIVGRIDVVGLWSVEGGRVALRAQIIDAWLGLEPGERVTNWAEDTGMCVLPDPSGRVTTARSWSVETSRGGTCSGISILTACPAASRGDERDRVLRLGLTRDETGAFRVGVRDAVANR